MIDRRPLSEKKNRFILWQRSAFTQNITRPCFPYIGSMPSFYILICISTLLMQHKMVIVFCTTKCFLVAVIVSGTCQSLLEIASLQEAILLGQCLPKRKVLVLVKSLFGWLFILISLYFSSSPRKPALLSAK